MMYAVTRTFIGGVLEGITITQASRVYQPVGFICEHPLGGSAYVIDACVECKQ